MGICDYWIYGFINVFFSFEIDEKTGYTNFQTAGMAFNKAMLSKKNLTPVWGGNDDEKKENLFSLMLKPKKINKPSFFKRLKGQKNLSMFQLNDLKMT
ncbi:hypothetical protein GCM10020331_012600 [Ectobacillus funiculus]